jgi:hypothetical protein
MDAVLHVKTMKLPGGRPAGAAIRKGSPWLLCA